MNLLITGGANLALGQRPSRIRLSQRHINGLTNLRVRVRDSGTGYRALRQDLARLLELRGRCTCGTFVLEAVHRGARLAEVPITLRSTEKPRQIAWYHAGQLITVVRCLVTTNERTSQH